MFVCELSFWSLFVLCIQYYQVMHYCQFFPKYQYEEFANIQLTCEYLQCNNIIVLPSLHPYSLAVSHSSISSRRPVSPIPKVLCSPVQLVFHILVQANQFVINLHRKCFITSFLRAKSLTTNIKPHNTLRRDNYESGL